MKKARKQLQKQEKIGVHNCSQKMHKYGIHLAPFMHFLVIRERNEALDEADKYEKQPSEQFNHAVMKKRTFV